MDTVIDLLDPDSALDLKNIRYQLIRLEDTIIFHFIERVQFPLNANIYQPGEISIPNYNGSFLDWMLHQQETMHARVRRYQAPDECPFFPNELPEPFLAPLSYPKLLHPNNVNVNAKIKSAYIENIIPAACRKNKDRGEEKENYGSSATNDVACLQALSRRVHFGKFVAEAKFRKETERFTKMIKERDIKGIEEAITDPAVEKQVLGRLELKARTYGIDPSEPREDRECRVNVDAIVNMYRDYIIPLTKEVEIEYLLQRLDPVTEVPTTVNGTK